MRRDPLIVFAKAPVAGYAKRRLIPALGEERAAAFQERLIRHTLETSVRTGHPVELWCAPDTAHHFFVQCASDYSVQLRKQEGDNLGERMLHAFNDVLGRHGCAVLIGCDCPMLSSAFIERAFCMLEKGQEAVLGPVEDGGYCLIGLLQPDPSLFADIPWGTGVVLELTRQRILSLGWQWEELPILWDVDRPEDLLRLETCEKTPKILLDISK